MIESAPFFRRLPIAMLNRMRGHIIRLYQAQSSQDQEAALFLLHCEMKDAQELMYREPQRKAEPQPEAV